MDPASQFSTDLPQPVMGVDVVRDTVWIQVSANDRAVAMGRALLNALVAGQVQEGAGAGNTTVAAGVKAPVWREKSEQDRARCRAEPVGGPEPGRGIRRPSPYAGSACSPGSTVRSAAFTDSMMLVVYRPTVCRPPMSAPRQLESPSAIPCR